MKSGEFPHIDDYAAAMLDQEARAYIATFEFCRVLKLDGCQAYFAGGWRLGVSD